MDLRPSSVLRSPALAPLFLTLVTAVVPPCATAQCATQWLPGPAVAGTDDNVYAATMWDPDGAGPVPPRLVIGGRFAVAGTVQANRIAAFDPLTGVWSTLGSGMDGTVSALAVLPNGDLVAGGGFTMAGGVSANGVARWNGSNWSALGSGVGLYGYGGYVTALAALPNGDLVAGGAFAVAGGVSANSIARWDGTSWSALGSGLPGPSSSTNSVEALAVLPNGDLVVGGAFANAGGVNANGIARWDGTSWFALGSGMGGTGRVTALFAMPNGDLVAGGWFHNAGGVSANGIARWDGTSWWAMGSGMSDGSAFTMLPNGDLAAGGVLSLPTGGFASVARWNGTSWSALGSGTTGSVVAVVTLPNGDLVAAGDFVSGDNIARWNGTTWSALTASRALDGAAHALVTLPNGDLIAGGAFQSAGGVIAGGIARFGGTSWSAIGSGTTGTVTALKTMPNGDLVAAGNFTSAGGVIANYIARWNGTSWSALGSGLGQAFNNYPGALAILPNGDLVAGGGGVVQWTWPFSYSVSEVRRWDGTTWSVLGSGMTGPSASVAALVVLPNGDLVAGGSFSAVGGVPMDSIARWNGSSWSAMGAGLYGSVNALEVLPNGDLVAGGNLPYANHIARWDGASWSSLGAGMNDYVRSLATLPNGDLVAGGAFSMAGGVAASGVARWNGTSWSALASGIGGPFGTGLMTVNAMAVLPSGDLVAGGNFTVMNGAVSAYMAQLTTTCPATAVSYGAGCTGAGGPNVLYASSLPWIGSTFRSVATGLASPSLAVGVLGLSTTSIPMPSIVAQGMPGCSLLTSPDLLIAYAPAAGVLQAQIVIPNSIALAGRVLHQQVVPIELGGGGSIAAFTSTNALALTIGSF